MLPYEEEVRHVIASRHREELEAMTSLHEVVMRMLTAGTWTVTRSRGISPFVVRTMAGLLTKASKYSERFKCSASAAFTTKPVS